MSTSVVDGAKTSPSIPPEPFHEQQTMLVLVGLIASGKSTFAKALECHLPRFRRCNQDDLGNRQQVEELAYRTLCEGRSPCIDRTNFNAIQRSYWSAIAREFPGTTISVIVFDTPYHICVSRLQQRTSHPTIRDAQHGIAVLQKFASEFQLPSPDEGYDHIIYHRPEDHPEPEYTRGDILSILERLKASTRDSGVTVTQRSTESPSAHRGRGYSRTGRARGYRGGGRSFSPSRGSLYGSRFTSRAGGSHHPSRRRPDPSGATNRETGDQRLARTASVPPMESSKEGLGRNTTIVPKSDPSDAMYGHVQIVRRKILIVRSIV